MKAITLHQPFASLIEGGVKNIETRTWKPPESLVGQRIAIHAASKKLTEQEWIDLPMSVSYKMYQRYGPQWRKVIPYGRVIATAKLVTYAEVLERHRDNRHVWCQRPTRAFQSLIATDPYGDFSVGRYLWFLDDIQIVEGRPIVRGRQKFWDWTPE